MEPSTIAQYLAVAPRNDFNRKMFGVQFSAGKAYLSGVTVPPHLGRTVDEVALELTKEGFQVQPQTDEAKAIIADWKAARASAPPSKPGFVRRAPQLKKNVIVRNEGEYKTEINEE